MHTRHLIALAFPFLFAAGVKAEDRNIAINDLPEAVTSSIRKEHPNAKILKAEEDIKDNVKKYEVKILDGQTEWEIHLRPDGTVLMKDMDD
jgi:hypothetical protein